jgi:hypothetical protein
MEPARGSFGTYPPRRAGSARDWVIEQSIPAPAEIVFYEYRTRPNECQFANADNWRHGPAGVLPTSSRLRAAVANVCIQATSLATDRSALGRGQVLEHVIASP